MVVRIPRLKRRHQAGHPLQPSTASALSAKQQEFLTTATNHSHHETGNIDTGLIKVEICEGNGQGDVEAGVEASCSSLTQSAAKSSPGRRSNNMASDGASIGIATDMMKYKHATNSAMKIGMKIHTKARKRGIKPVQSSSVLSQPRDDCASSRKIPWPSFERRPGNYYGGDNNPKSCLKPKRSNAFFGSRISRRSFGSRKKLSKPAAAAKKVHFKESSSVCSDGVESIASCLDDVFEDLDYYFDEDDDEDDDTDYSFIDDSRYSGSQVLSENGCQACAMFYQPGSQTGLYYRQNCSDYNSVYSSYPYSDPTPRREEYNEPIKCEVMDNFVYLTGAKNKSNNANACEKVNAGLSNATALLLDSCDNVLGLCTRERPDEYTSLSGADDDQIIHQYKFEHRTAPKKICNANGYGCTSLSSEIHNAEGRDDIESSLNELGTAAITNLERVMEVVDDVLFPVDTKIRSRHEEVGTTSNKETETRNSSLAARSFLNDSIKKSKWNPKSNKGIVVNKGVTTKKDAIFNSALSKDVSKRSSKFSKAANTNSETAESVVVSTSIHNDDPPVPWLYKIMDEINDEKFVSWKDLFKDPTSNETIATEHAIDAKKVDECFVSKVSEERTCTVPNESISSKMRNLFKNTTTMNKICAGAQEPIVSIEPANQSYFPAGTREPEKKKIQPFAGVYDANCGVPKYILASDDGHGAISSWRDAVADTVEFTTPSTNGNRMKSQVHTQQQQEFYPPEILAPTYPSSRFPTLSTLNHDSSHRAGTQIKYDPVLISPRGNIQQSNPIRDRYCHNMNGEAHPQQGPVVPPNIGIISGAHQHQCSPVPTTSRLPPNVPSINSNLSEVSTNQERDRYAGMEQQDTMAEQNNHKLIFPGPRLHVGSQRTMMMGNNNNAHLLTQHPPRPYLHVQYNQFDRFSSGQQQCQHTQHHFPISPQLVGAQSSPGNYHARTNSITVPPAANYAQSQISAPTSIA